MVDRDSSIGDWTLRKWDGEAGSNTPLSGSDTGEGEMPHSLLTLTPYLQLLIPDAGRKIGTRVNKAGKLVQPLTGCNTQESRSYALMGSSTGEMFLLPGWEWEPRVYGSGRAFPASHLPYSNVDKGEVPSPLPLTTYGKWESQLWGNENGGRGSVPHLGNRVEMSLLAGWR